MVDARRVSLLIYIHIYSGHTIVGRRAETWSVLLILFCGQEVEISDQRTGADHTMVSRQRAAARTCRTRPERGAGAGLGGGVRKAEFR